jgi:hypothetical protein
MRSSVLYLNDNKEVVARVTLLYDHLTIIKLAWLKSISYCHTLPRVQALCTQVSSRICLIIT